MPRKYPLLYDRAWLEQKYLEEKLSSRAISELIGCGTTSVENGLKRFGIPARKDGGSHRKHPLLLDKAWLEQKYLEEGLGTREIGKLIERSPGRVSEALKHLDVPIRNHSESQIRFRELWDKGWLEEKYLEDMLGSVEIANILGCTSTPVLNALKRFNISIRDPKEAHKRCHELYDRQWLEENYVTKNLSSHDVAKLVGCSCESVLTALNRLCIPIQSSSKICYKELSDKEWLEWKYIGEGLCFREISEIIGCCATGVGKALRRFNIPIRSSSEALKGRRSEDAKRQHSERMKGNTYRLGIPHTDEVKSRMSEKRKCRVFSEETKRKISESKKGKRNPMYGVAPWNKGKKGLLSEETIQKIKEARKRQVFPRHHTKIERILIEIFDRNDLPIKYTGDSALWIKTPEMNINPDFIVEGKKIAIEANGEWTHYSLCNYKKRVSSGKVHREKLLKSVGWKLIVFWEFDILRADAEAFVLSVLRKRDII